MITVVGMADRERIVKAIRKTKRIPTIFSDTNPAEAQNPPANREPSPPTEPPAEAPPAEVTAADEPAPENKEAPTAETPAMDAVVGTVDDDPYGDGHHFYREKWVNHPMEKHGIRCDAAPYHVNHSYSASYSHSWPSSHIAEYGYGVFPVQEGRYYSYDYYPATGKGDGSQITSMFSDENPNACSMV